MSEKIKTRPDHVLEDPGAQAIAGLYASSYLEAAKANNIEGADEELASFRRAFSGYEAALAPPRVMLGDTLASSTYWHGKLMNSWANDWVRLYGGEGAEFVTTNMEDSGTLTALSRLAEIGRAAENLAAQGIKITIADARFAKPLDTGLIDQLARHQNHERSCCGCEVFSKQSTRPVSAHNEACDCSYR